MGRIGIRHLAIAGQILRQKATVTHQIYLLTEHPKFFRRPLPLPTTTSVTKLVNIQYVRL